MPLEVQEGGTAGAPSIVFLHGIGTSGWMWAAQRAGLSDFHTLTVDLPGHGSSRDIPWVSLADTADRVAQVIETRATGGRAHLVGLSLGGYIALVLLERCRAVVERVVISGVTSAPVPNRWLLPAQLWLTSALFKARWFVNMQARALPLTPDMQAAFSENLLAMSMEAYRRIYTEGVTFRLPPALAQVPNPTLALAGGRESRVITEAVADIVRLMPNAEGRFAPGRGHGWNIEAPALFNATVRAWLTGGLLPDALSSSHSLTNAEYS